MSPPFFRLLALWLSIAAATKAAEIRKFSQATLESLGAAIYEQDSCVSQARELVRAARIDLVKENVRGWITEGGQRTDLVRFVREKDGRFEAFRDVRFGGKTGPALSAPANPTLSPAQTARFRAQLLAEKSIGRPASDTHHIVVLPDPENDGWLAYALAATSGRDEVMIGGHYRFTISKDGQELRQSDPLYVSFVTMNAVLPASSSYSAALGTLSINTQVSNQPLETHVYLNLLRKIELRVTTGDQSTWRIRDGKMTRLN